MSETLQILEKVNAFYSASFTQLVTYTGALLALVGVLLPLFIAFQQARQTKRDHDQLSRSIDEKFARERIEFAEFIKRESAGIDQRLQDLVNATKKEVSAEAKQIEHFARAAIFHVQSRQYISQGLPGHAFCSACMAAKYYARARDERNLSTVLGIIFRVLSYANKAHIQAGEEQEPGEYEKFREAVKTLNEHGRYTDDLRRLQSMYEEANARDPVGRGTNEASAED